MLVLDRGPDAPAVLLDVDPRVALVVAGEDERAIDREALAQADAEPLPHVHPLPPPEVDVDTAELRAPMGAVGGAAAAVRELGARYPGRSVLTVHWPTSDPRVPLGIAARGGEPLVILLGEAQYPMPAGWP
jgi:hypothetical protein